VFIYGQIVSFSHSGLEQFMMSMVIVGKAKVRQSQICHLAVPKHHIGYTKQVTQNSQEK
jgi:hypothetical protein